MELSTKEPCSLGNVRKKSLWRIVIGQRQLVFMSFPFVLWCVVFSYIPIWGWITAFMDYKPYKGLFDQTWIGMDNFVRLFQTDMFWLSLRNTLAMSLINLVLGFVTAIGLAILLNEVRQTVFKKVIQTISYLPHFVSWVVAANLVYMMLSLDGPVNALLGALGLTDAPVLFLGIKEAFWGIIGLSATWKEVGWNAIIYLAAMSMISPDFYEAAEIDGASRFQKIRHITLPGIRSVFVILLIMSIGYLLSSGFEQPYLLQNNLVTEYSQNLDIYVLKQGIAQGFLSFATAAGIFKSLVSVVLILMTNSLAKRMDEPGIL